MAIIKADLVKRNLLTPDLGIFIFHPERRLEFIPGQYTTLFIKSDGFEKPIARPYSIASDPYERDIELYFKYVLSGGRRDDGRGMLTSEIFPADLPDLEYELINPKGKFFLKEDDKRDVVMVGTGTGIAPFISMLRSESRKGSKKNYILIHGVAYSRDLSYRDELMNSPLNLYYGEAISREDHETKYIGELFFNRKSGKKGRITLEEIEETKERGRIENSRIDKIYTEIRNKEFSSDNAVIMACGNPGMIANVEKLGEIRGFEKGEGVVIEEYW